MNVGNGVDFFVSYTQSDRSWAEWIAWELETAGFTTMLQAWDFGPGANFPLAMDRATRTAKRTITFLSPAYLASLYTKPEWAAAFASDPTGERRTMVPIRVQSCQLTGLLRSRVCLDLVDKDEGAARQALLDGLRPGRLKPAARPHIPGHRQNAAPDFPGAAVFCAPLRNSTFTGRDQLLIDLDATLASGTHTALVQTITGLGGVGKTQVAIEYAHRHRNDYRLISWIRAEMVQTIVEDLAALASPLALTVFPDTPPADVAAAVLRQLEATPGWLLVFDNAESLDAVRNYIPDHGHVLIISRNPAWRSRAAVLDPPGRSSGGGFHPAGLRHFSQHHQSANFTTATEQTGPSWSRQGSASGMPPSSRHTRTVPSAPPETTTG